MARLEKRRQLYYAIRDIPKHLQKHFEGKRRFIESTGESTRVTAVHVAAELDVKWLAALERAEFGPRAQTAGEALQELTARAEHLRERIRLNRNNAASYERLIEMAKDEAQLEIDDEAPDSDNEGLARAEMFMDIVMGKDVSLSDHVEAFLAEKSKDTSPKTIDLYRTTLNSFVALFPMASDVTPQSLGEWLRGLRDEGLADNTIQRNLSASKGLWRYLQERGVLDLGVDPFNGLRMQKDKSPNRRGKEQPYVAFEPSEVVTLLRAAEERKDSQLANLIQLAMWTGARIESLCSLKASDVSEEAIQLNDKTEAGNRLVPIHTQLKPLLERLCASTEDGYVLSGLTENKYGDRSNAIGKRFGRLKDKLGFEDRRWAFHSIRKTVTTQFQRAGVPEEVAKAILGHENDSITYGLYSAGPSNAQKQYAISLLDYPRLR